MTDARRTIRRSRWAAVLWLLAGLLVWPSLALASPAQRIDVSQTNAVLSLPFDLTAHGTSDGDVTQIDITHNAGQVHFGNRFADALAYQQQSFAFAGLTLYQVISTEADQWHVFWLYCAGSSLMSIYHEDTRSGSSGFAAASGSCDATMTPTNTLVHLAPTSMRFPKLLTQYEVNGPEVQVTDGEPGSIVIDGRTLTLLPFTDVDCSTGCGFSGWYELHVLIWDPERGQASFAILYLQQDAPDSVLLAYGLTLPNGQLLPDQVFTNTYWSVQPESVHPGGTPTQNQRQVGSATFVDAVDCVAPLQVDEVWSFVTHTYLDANGYVYRLQFTGSVRATFTNLVTGQTRTVNSSGPGTIDFATGSFTLRGNNAFVFDQAGSLTDSSGRLVYDSQGNLVTVTGRQRPVCEMLGTQALH